ncbi:MAG: hypothetical protein ACMUHY_01760 [Thermoplasmatota archaeon]
MRMIEDHNGDVSIIEALMDEGAIRTVEYGGHNYFIRSMPGSPK